MRHLAFQERAAASSHAQQQSTPVTLAVSNAAVEGLVPAKALIQRKLSGAVPALRAPYALTEVLVEDAQDGAASAFVWALAHGAALQRPLVVWVQDRMSSMEAGKPYVPGLGQGDALAQRFVLIEAKAGQDMLWAMEEVLLSGAASCVIGEVWGLPKALNFTATKRLQRSAQIGKTPCLLLRYGREKVASGAHERWQVASRPSQPQANDTAAPGNPRWNLDLFKARARQPSVWTVDYKKAEQKRGADDDRCHEKQAHRLHLAAPLADGPVFKNPASNGRGGVCAYARRAARPGGL